MNRKMTWMMWMVCLIALLAAMAGCGGVDARKAKYTALAHQYIDEGNWPKARVALRNLLKIDPNSAEGYYLYGQVEEKEKNWTNAFRNYLKVVEINPDHYDALTRLGKFYLEGGEPDKAEETADRILATHPDDAVAETLKAGVLAKQGHLTDAIVKAESVHQRYPDNPDAAIMLAALYSQQQRPQESVTVLKRTLQANPNNTPLLISLGNSLMQSGKTDEAEQVFQHLIKLEPKVLDHRVRLAVLYEQSKRPDQAEAVLREAIKLNSDDEQRWLVLAQLVAARSDAKKEESVLLEARKALPDSIKIRFALGRLYELTERKGQARQVYEEIVAENKKLPPGLEAQVKLAALDWSGGKTEAAQQRLDEVLKENPQSADALTLRGRMSLARQDGKEAVQDFRLVLKDQPRNAEIELLLGQAYLLTGETALAMDSLEKALSINPKLPEAHLMLARLEMAEGHRAEARTHLELMLRDTPKDQEALSMLVDLQLADQDWRGAEETIGQLREAGVSPFVVYIAEGGLASGRKQWDKAVDGYEKAAAAQPDNPEPLVAIVKIDMGRGRTEQARQRLERLIAARPDHPYAHGLLGQVLVMKKELRAAETEFRDAARIKPEWELPWLNLAALKLGQKNSGEAITILEEGLKANPKSPEMRMLLATTLTGAGRPDASVEQYEILLKQNPSAVWAANNLAMLLVEKGDPESLKRAVTLTQNFDKTSAHPALLDTMAWVEVKTGRSAEAVPVLEQVVKRSPDQPVFNYHLGMAYYESGDHKQAAVYLAKAVDSGRTFQGLGEAKTTLTQLRRIS